ncbi:lipopolysaccharide export system protein LptA [Roseovarius nanhaiticus]|uniref:Lipopolysaccharide export system protein LptA n=1 Tax=Roseovarius nanhaiticus TaxID=573024 RepID=A0A1N7E8I5_9RHOB|nr:lipopolysaccharide export system protein LptA [Roseovarius nanhaiticus]SIR84370.1 lipopolysaccharide export system protein LptA [Roseovarius nanhaiticus]
MPRIIQAMILLIMMAFGTASLAQGMQVAFGSAAEDSDLPVEVTAQNLDVNQNDGTAIFTGNVVVGQGQMRLSAPRVLVVYLADGTGIARLEASGGVTLVSGEDAAEAAGADYDVQTGMIEMAGDVLLVQGPAALTADRMSVDTVAGTARMNGSVSTVLQPEARQ